MKDIHKDELTGVVDCPVTIANTMVELVAWLNTVKLLAESEQKRIALAEVNMLIRLKSQS